MDIHITYCSRFPGQEHVLQTLNFPRMGESATEILMCRRFPLNFQDPSSERPISVSFIGSFVMRTLAHQGGYRKHIISLSPVGACHRVMTFSLYQAEANA